MLLTQIQRYNMGFWKHTAINKVDIVFIVYKINLKKKKCYQQSAFIWWVVMTTRLNIYYHNIDCMREICGFFFKLYM